MGRPPKVRWNIALLEEDRAKQGWSYSDLAAEAGVSLPTVTRFVRGQHQFPKAAKRIALALGHPVARYVIESSGRKEVA